MFRSGLNYDSFWESGYQIKVYLSLLKPTVIIIVVVDDSVVVVINAIIVDLLVGSNPNTFICGQ